MLVEQLDADFTSALKSRDAEKLAVLRRIRSNIKNAEITKKEPVSDDEVIAILRREIKQHKESIEANEKAGRTEEVDRLNGEIAMLSAYLPQQLSEDELQAVVRQAIADTGAQGAADTGKVMARVMPEVKGRASGDDAGRVVRKLLK